jgi:hypothetical protein
MTRWRLRADVLRAWLTLQEAAHLTGIAEDVLLHRALIGVIRAQMRFGLEYLSRDDVIGLMVNREGAPNGHVFRVPEADGVAVLR